MISQRTLLSRKGLTIAEFLVILAIMACVIALGFAAFDALKPAPSGLRGAIVSAINDNAKEGKLTEKSCSKAAGAIVSAYGENSFQKALSSLAIGAVPKYGSGGATRFAGTAVWDGGATCIIAFENPSDPAVKLFYRPDGYQYDLGIVTKAFLKVEFFAKEHFEHSSGSGSSGTGSEFLLTPPDLGTGAVR